MFYLSNTTTKIKHLSNLQQIMKYAKKNATHKSKNYGLLYVTPWVAS